MELGGAVVRLAEEDDPGVADPLEERSEVARASLPRQFDDWVWLDVTSSVRREVVGDGAHAGSGPRLIA